MAKPSSQKFIARNRAPRVQIEYDVEVYGAQKKVQIPFVMGVLADLSGDAKDPRLAQASLPPRSGEPLRPIPGASGRAQRVQARRLYHQGEPHLRPGAG